MMVIDKLKIKVSYLLKSLNFLFKKAPRLFILDSQESALQLHYVWAALSLYMYCMFWLSQGQ